jgi:hypothetical protein
MLACNGGSDGGAFANLKDPKFGVGLTCGGRSLGLR